MLWRYVLLPVVKLGTCSLYFFFVDIRLLATCSLVQRVLLPIDQGQRE